ncbi:MAG: hypothetical protein IT379_40935 [Deltaproteobacteria bacterium]|nr:hypothetical protein [Deltaproteobacteria bacterium]
MSGDGTLVVFETRSASVVAGDTNGERDVFVRDLEAATTFRVSVGTGGTEASRGGFDGFVSANGRYVVFVSSSDELAPPGGAQPDVFLHDLVTRETTLVSIDATGGPSNRGSSRPSVSDDGRHVVFQSEATDLVTATDLNATYDVFLRDRVAGVTTCLSLLASGTTGASTSDRPIVAADGSLVAFASYAALLPGDTDVAQDVYLVPLP